MDILAFTNYIQSDDNRNALLYEAEGRLVRWLGQTTDPQALLDGMHTLEWLRSQRVDRAAVA